MYSSLILAMFVHVLMTAVLYALLTVLRAPVVWGLGKNKAAWLGVEKRLSANLSNQFEWPLFFYVLCLLLTLGDFPYRPAYTWLAWVFVVGRVLHSLVQIGTANVRLRGLVFVINFLAVIAMWLILIIDNYIDVKMP